MKYNMLDRPPTSQTACQNGFTQIIHDVTRDEEANSQAKRVASWFVRCLNMADLSPSPRHLWHFFGDGCAILLMEEILHHFQRPTVETSRSQVNIVLRHSDQNGFVRVTEILHHLSACHSTLSLGVRGCKLCSCKCMVTEVVQDFFHPP